MGRSRVRVRVIPKFLEMVLTAPQPVLVILSLSKGNALYLIQWTSRQRWYNSKTWMSDKIKGHKTYGPFKVSSHLTYHWRCLPIRILWCLFRDNLFNEPWGRGFYLKSNNQDRVNSDLLITEYYSIGFTKSTINNIKHRKTNTVEYFYWCNKT